MSATLQKILITPRSLTKNGHPEFERLREAGFEVIFCSPGKSPSEPELQQLLVGCVGYLAGVETVSSETLRAAKDLRVIARNGVGINNIDLVAARELGIPVCPTPGANSRGVAELAMALLLGCARSVAFCDHAIKAGRWERPTGIELEGKILGILGCGNIGRRLTRMALAMDMRVMAYDVLPDATFEPGDGFTYAPLNEVLDQADMISLHCPPTTDGKPLLDASALQRLKKGAIIVNTARADLIDSRALVAALEAAHIAAAGIDVFDSEPPGNDPLAHCDRVIATPHVGGLTAESVERSVRAAVDSLLQHLK